MSIEDSRSKLLEIDSSSEIVKMWRRLRVKGFYCLLVLGCVAFSSLTVLFSAHLPQRPTIRTIVEDHLESLRREIVKSDSIVEEGDNGGIAQNHHLMRVDQDILLLLGLPYSPEDIYTPKLRSQGSNLEEFHGLETKVPFSTPVAWPDSPWRKTYGNASEPVIVTAAGRGQSGDLNNLLRSIRTHFPPSTMTTVIVFDIGLSTWELEQVKMVCRSANNASQWLGQNQSDCRLWQFPHHPLLKYPSHVRASAYRPLAIQEVLRNAGSVLYVSPSQRFISGNLTKYLDFARNGEGISAWPTQRRLPTTSMTHPNMFDVFLRQTQFQGMNAADPAEEADSPVDIADYQSALWLFLATYQFQHMIGMDALILYNTERIMERVMLPWVKCALTQRCVNPIGAQDTGCRFDKKPQYRYSGCHAYDISALNVVLGQSFQFDESKYICCGQETAKSKAATDKFFTSNYFDETGPSSERPLSDELS